MHFAVVYWGVSVFKFKFSVTEICLQNEAYRASCWANWKRSQFSFLFSYFLWSNQLHCLLNHRHLATKKWAEKWTKIFCFCYSRRPVSIGSWKNSGNICAGSGTNLGPSSIGYQSPLCRISLIAFLKCQSQGKILIAVCKADLYYWLLELAPKISVLYDKSSKLI